MSAGQRLVRLAGEDDPDRFIPDAVEWAYEATWPPLHWLLGQAEPTPAELARWMARESSEASIRRLVMLLDNGDPAGGFIALPASEVPACRHADTMALITGVSRPARPELLRRLRAVAQLQAPIDAGAYYLSRVGVSRQFRGRGLGRTLVEGFLEAGRSQGFRRFCLDVRPDNSAAVRLYESVGFRPVAAHSAEGMRSMTMLLQE